MSTATIDSPFARKRLEKAPSPALTLRAMTGFEEEALEGLSGEINAARVTNEMLARCLVPPGHDFAEALAFVHRMSVLERDATLLKLRILSTSDRVEQGVECPHCRAKNTASFRLSDLPISKGRGADARELKVELPSGGSATVGLPSSKDQEDLFDAHLESAAARKSFLISRVLKRLRETSGGFTFESVHALPSNDRDAIEQALDRALAELDLSMAADCSACGANFEQPFDIAGFFFRR